MEIGFETIGNAILIGYDRTPVLVTDPWITGSAYFGSWTFSHEIPGEQIDAIKKCEFVWISHGHPDHLSGASLTLLQNKKILLPDHVGQRICQGLREQGYDVTVLRDRVWTPVSRHIRILCIADYNQDAILLLDINGRLVVNTNDASPRGWGGFIKNEIKNYKVSFLLSLSGFDDADMINFHREDGSRVLSPTFEKPPLGRAIARRAEKVGAKYFLPFSSMHRYQRKDSVWANAYIVSNSDYPNGFDSKRSEILPPFIRYDCVNDHVEPMNPPERPLQVLEPEEFGDRWEERLERPDVEAVEKYFKSIRHLETFLDFVRVRVGGQDHTVRLAKRNFNRGITFEAPRNSLMTSIQYEIFDDLLIGNFMKTTLHGKWSSLRLYPDFTPYVAKYADNGHAKTKEELLAYFGEYRRRAFLDFVLSRFRERARIAFRICVPTDSKAYKIARHLVRRMRKET